VPLPTNKAPEVKVEIPVPPRATGKIPEVNLAVSKSGISVGSNNLHAGVPLALVGPAKT